MAKTMRKARTLGASSSAAARGGLAGSSPTSPSAESSTRLEVSVATRSVPGKNGGTLTPHAPGSNGGVHRGRDRFPRANVGRAVVLMTFAASGLDVNGLPESFRALQAARRKSHRKLIPAAAAKLMVEANMNIITRAAMGDDTVYGQFLTLQRDFHRIMASGNGDNR